MTNLREYLPELTLEELKKALRESFLKRFIISNRKKKKMQDLDADEVEEKEGTFFFILEMAVWKKTGLPVRDESQICMGRDYYAVSGRCRKD